MRSTLRTGRLLGLLLAGALAGALPLAADDWRLATQLPEGSVQIQSLELFAQDIEAASKGRIAPGVYPAEGLEGVESLVAAVQGGSVPLATLSLGELAAWGPLFEADSLPTLAGDYPAARRLWEVLRDPLQRAFWREGLILLFSAPQAPRGLLGPSGLTSAMSLSGESVGGSTPLAVELAAKVGAEAVSASDLELAESFRDGGLTAAFLGAPEALRGITDEAAVAFYPLNSWVPLTVVVMNKGAFETLGRAEQEMLRTAAENAEAQAWAAGEAQNDSILRLLERDGFLVRAPLLRRQLTQAGRAVAAAWLERAGIQGQSLLRAYRN